MRYKIIPIFMIMMSTILFILAQSNLSIGDGYLQAPTGWLSYLIWSLSVVSIISYFICKFLTKSWCKLTGFIVQLITTIVLYIINVSIIPFAFTSPLKSDYYTHLIFRPLSHVIHVPFISLSIIEDDSPYPIIKQEIHFFGFLGYSKSGHWNNQKNNPYIGKPENDPATLEYALHTGNKTDFVNKFQALLDARFDGTTSQNLEALMIDKNHIANDILMLLPEQAHYNAVDIMLAFGELDLMDKISGVLSTTTKWTNGAIFIDLENDQLYHYYHLAKDHNKIRFVGNRYYNFYFAGDYFWYAIKYCDSNLIHDLVEYNNELRAVYTVFSINKVAELTAENPNYAACMNTVKTFIDVKPFGQFKQEVTGEKKIDSMIGSRSDVGLAIKYNGKNLAPYYNSVFDALQHKNPEAYHYMIDKGYGKIE